jgi:endonuclease YncB( thermonuclease family)
MTGVRALHEFCLGILVLWLAAGVTATQATGLSGRVVGVVDGDTVDLLTDSKQLIRVRLAGIDAPERRQPFGSVAKNVLSELVFSQQAALEGERKDRYGPLVAKVIVGGQDANLRLVRLGYAWHFKRYQTEQSGEDAGAAQVTPPRRQMA